MSSGSTLVCIISGRLDTITGPELLSEYRAQNTDGIQEIIMDLADTEYISSAGLRVINIMSESLPDPDEFRFKNVTEDVMDRLEVTGFADVYEILSRRVSTQIIFLRKTLRHLQEKP